MLRHYGINKPEPNVFAIQYLLERISLFMAYNHPDKQAIVIMDKCSDSIEKMLNRTHSLQIENGYSWKGVKNIIENIMFVDSQYNNFIQLTYEPILILYSVIVFQTSPFDTDPVPKHQ